MRMQHTVFITADNTDVFTGSIFEEVPGWARTARLQILASDYDWLFSGSIGGTEIARDSAPHRFGADNLGNISYDSPFIELPVSPGQDVDIDINVVTAGTGQCMLEFDSGRS